MDWDTLYSGLVERSRVVVFLGLGAGFVVYYLLEVVKRPLVACREDSRWHRFLENHLSILNEQYWPTLWCFESRIQTILASVLRSTIPDITYTREVFLLSDGGEVCLDWLSENKGSATSQPGANEEKEKEKEEHSANAKGTLPDKSRVPIVVILPGLTGSSQSEYVKSFVHIVQAAGARCVVFNNRGRGGIQLKTARTYCAANSDDLEEAIEHIQAGHPNAPLVATGISLGGMILGNYLVTRSEKAAQQLVAAMVVSIPWNVVIGTASLERPFWNLLLNRHLAGCLCESIKSMRPMLEGDNKFDLDHIMKSKTIREFDTRFTAVQFGFEDVEDYYRNACLHDKLERIRVPLLCLTAADDPFQPFEGLPLESATNSSHVAIVVTSRGGHIGFMEGIFPTNTYYSDRLYAQLIKAVFNNLDEMKEVKSEGKKYVTENVVRLTSGSTRQTL